MQMCTLAFFIKIFNDLEIFTERFIFKYNLYLLEMQNAEIMKSNVKNIERSKRLLNFFKRLIN